MANTGVKARALLLVSSDHELPSILGKVEGDAAGGWTESGKGVGLIHGFVSIKS